MKRTLFALIVLTLALIVLILPAIVPAQTPPPTPAYAVFVSPALFAQAPRKPLMSRTLYVWIAGAPGTDWRIEAVFQTTSGSNETRTMLVHIPSDWDVARDYQLAAGVAANDVKLVSVNVLAMTAGVSSPATIVQ